MIFASVVRDVGTQLRGVVWAAFLLSLVDWLQALFGLRPCFEKVAFAHLGFVKWGAEGVQPAVAGQYCVLTIHAVGVVVEKGDMRNPGLGRYLRRGNISRGLRVLFNRRGLLEVTVFFVIALRWFLLDLIDPCEFDLLTKSVRELLQPLLEVLIKVWFLKGRLHIQTPLFELLYFHQLQLGYVDCFFHFVDSLEHAATLHV